MAAPNLVNIATIYGKAATVSLSSTSATALLSNAASSGKVLKVNYIGVTNSTSSFVSITLNYYNAAAIGGTAFPMSYQISVPANATLVLLQTPFYLEENTSLGVTAGVGSSALSVVCSYEDLS